MAGRKGREGGGKGGREGVNGTERGVPEKIWKKTYSPFKLGNLRLFSKVWAGCGKATWPTAGR